MKPNELTIFQQLIEACEDPTEIARKVKLTFKRMPGETALACFAKVMTAELPHPIKVAVWDAVRYSHIWWAGERWSYALIPRIVYGEDAEVARAIARSACGYEWMRDQLVGFIDMRGNNLLWYLAYRDDQNARGGFACPCIERELLRIGVDPNHRNNLGLCWNDVKHHVIRPEV